MSELWPVGLLLSSYSENMKLQNFIILKLSINSSDKGIGKDLYRDKNPLKLRHKGVTYVTINYVAKSCEGLTYNSSVDIYIYIFFNVLYSLFPLLYSPFDV